jgi:FixJ family two-component response regulator
MRRLDDQELKSSIVIIEDDILVRQALGDCVESAGYAVEDFGSAEEFLASGATQKAACMIVDIQLPGLTGLELQDQLTGVDNRLPIVFVSAQGSNANREKAMKQGASGFLSKPFRREDLLKILGEAIEHSIESSKCPTSGLPNETAK